MFGEAIVSFGDYHKMAFFFSLLRILKHSNLAVAFMEIYFRNEKKKFRSISGQLNDVGTTHSLSEMVYMWYDLPVRQQVPKCFRLSLYGIQAFLMQFMMTTTGDDDDDVCV